MDNKQNLTAVYNDYNGAVVCFQKHAPAPLNQKIPASPACLGYFNRVDVKLVRDFFENVQVTSEHEAGIPCSRKQMVLRRIKALRGAEEVRLINSTYTKNGLPFVSTDEKEYALCCFSVFNVSEDGKMSHKRKHAVTSVSDTDETHTQIDYYEGLARELYVFLNDLKGEYDFRISFLELLGAEDLCLIVLSNQCEALSAVISRLQEYNCGENVPISPYAGCRVDNIHSILLLDRLSTNAMGRKAWGSIKAEIHFSLHSISGMSYLRKLEPVLLDYVIEHSGQQEADEILLESCSGEFDAILRCPGWLLPVLLGEPGNSPIEGCFHPDHSEFKRKIYQSDTYLHPFGLNKNVQRDQEEPAELETPDQDAMLNFVTNAMKQLEAVFEDRERRKDFKYLKLPVWRLLKEYWSFASFPMSNDLRDDLEKQFKVSINAIVREAELSKEAEQSRSDMLRKEAMQSEATDPERKAKLINKAERGWAEANSYQNKSCFLEKYDAIVRALDASMQTGSQQDRWYFGEQRSYINNVDSYYKILRCYYGILKKMIELIYHIPREQMQSQHYLIPLLSFGVNPLIKSDEYESFIDSSMDDTLAEGERRDAKLICISLPYQALSNPLKYLGILAHEIFHYSKPADRRNRNELMLKGLIKVAISEFIDMLALSADGSMDKDFWPQAYSKDEAFRTIVDRAICNIYANILTSGKKKTANKDAYIRLKDIGTIIMEKELRFSRDPSKQGYETHYRIWRGLRNFLWEKLNVPAEQQHPQIAAMPDFKAEYVPLYRKMFALDKARLHPAVDEAAEKELSQIYWDTIKPISRDQTIRARNLLLTTYKAMVECPPDIYDLEVVMSGRNNDGIDCAEEKIRQFLWQQFNVKRDLMATLIDNGGLEGRPLLLKNDIRIAMVISCYLRQRRKNPGPHRAKDDPRELEEVLTNWGTCTYTEDFAKAKREFQQIYERVFTRFQYLFDENCSICLQIAQRIRGLENTPKTERIIRELTAAYATYHETLNEYQRDSRDREQWHGERCDSLFWQICDLIDAYQYQEPYVVKGDTSGQWKYKDRDDLRATSVWDQISFACDEIAYSVDDLVYKLSRAYERMMINGRMPQLWYRGQRQVDWKTLPNIMRLKRFESTELDSEGFADAMAYQMQLAQAHILPEGEHLSRSEWPAFLQHYSFKTSTLDFSESLSPALFFATEKWSEKANRTPKHDAVIMVFNPVLYNLVMVLLESEKMLADVKNAIRLLGSYGVKSADAGAVLEKACEVAKQALRQALEAGEPLTELKRKGDAYTSCFAAVMALKQTEGDEVWRVLKEREAVLEQQIEKAQQSLKHYFEIGITHRHPPLFSGPTERKDDPYRYLYDMTQMPYHDQLHPRAVMVPRHCDRMDKQSGEFVYYNLSSAKGIEFNTGKDGKVTYTCNYSNWSLEQLHEVYVARIQEDLKLKPEDRKLLPIDGEFIPFLCRITINRYRYRGFKRYIYAMGMHKFSVYPEYDKLAEDLSEELALE